MSICQNVKDYWQTDICQRNYYFDRGVSQLSWQILATLVETSVFRCVGGLHGFPYNRVALENTPQHSDLPLSLLPPRILPFSLVLFPLYALVLSSLFSLLLFLQHIWRTLRLHDLPLLLALFPLLFGAFYPKLGDSFPTTTSPEYLKVHLDLSP